jgi:hypothetical protein
MDKATATSTIVWKSHLPRFVAHCLPREARSFGRPTHSASSQVIAFDKLDVSPLGPARSRAISRAARVHVAYWPRREPKLFA